MATFKRARSAEQKEARMEEIKQAAAELFATRPYHEITLTTIADKLTWTRANLYKYVTTKEEVFLSLAKDERDAYYDDLLSSFELGRTYNASEAAEIWANAMDRNREFFRLHDLLFTIIETNVSLECLIDFKRGYYEQIEALSTRLSAATGVDAKQVEHLMNTLHYHAVGIVSNCCDLSQVREALAVLNVTYQPVDFRAEMTAFIEMCLHGMQD